MPNHVNPRSRPATHGVYSPVELAATIQSSLVAVKADGRDGEMRGRVWRVAEWERWGMAERLAFMHAFAEDTARDPTIADLAASIVRNAGVKDRDYKGQWAALLAWVQKNITYVNEPNERLQSPQFTLTKKLGDCDDLAILLMALGWSIRLSSKFVISGRGKDGQRVRWIEGQGPCPPANYAHIYLAVGWPVFEPTTWCFAEPTLKVPLGWDVMTAPRDKNGKTRLPEMGGDATKSALPSSAADPVASGPQSSGGLSSGVTAWVKSLPWTQISATVVGSVLSYTITTRLIADSRRKRR